MKTSNNRPKPTDSLGKKKNKKRRSHFPSRFTTLVPTQAHRTFEILSIWLFLVRNRSRNQPIVVRLRCCFFRFNIIKTETDRNWDLKKPNNNEKLIESVSFSVHDTGTVLLYYTPEHIPRHMMLECIMPDMYYGGP